MIQLLIHSSLILLTLMIQATGCFEPSILRRATLRQIPEDGIFQLSGAHA
jgi:hypothetical protein